MRFPEFKGEWRACSLGTSCEGFDYGLNTPAIAFDGIHKYIRITDVDDQTGKIKNDSIVSPKELNLDSLVKKNDILFARTGASVGKTYLQERDEPSIYFAGFLIRANVKTDFDPYFVYSETKTQHYLSWVKLMSMRSGQPGINSKEYMSFKFKIPSREEQRKIGRLLRLIDTRIDVQRKTIEDWKNLLDWYISQTFGDHGMVQGEQKAKLRNLLIPGSKVPVETSRYKKATIKLHLEGMVWFDGTRQMKDTRPFYIRNCGELIIGKQNYFSGSIAIVPKEFDGCVCSNAIMSFSFSPEVDRTFLFFAIANKDFLQERSYLANGTGQKELSEKDFLNFEISLPRSEKQKKIGQAIKTIQKRIGVEKNILERLKEEKEYLLESMFA